METNHTNYLQQTIQLAQQANDSQEGFPFGAIIVSDDNVISACYNQEFKNKDCTAHAELLAIKDACQKLDQSSLEECVMYCSSEPCVMCHSAIFLSKIKIVYYAMSHDQLKQIWPQISGFNSLFIRDFQNQNKSERKVPFIHLENELAPLNFQNIMNPDPYFLSSGTLQFQNQQADQYETYEDYDQEDLQQNQQPSNNIKVNNQITESSQNIYPQQILNKGITKSDQFDQVLKINNTQLLLKRTSKIDLKLFVGQIPKNWQEQDVTNFFSKYGQILESQIIRKNGNHNGCAFVKFASMTNAEKACEALRDNAVDGMSTSIQIKWADGEAERLGVEPGKTPKLFVGSLPKECSEQNLRDIFEGFGEIEELHLNKDNDNRSKGTAIIRFAKTEATLLAIRNLNAQAYFVNSDRPIEVRFAERKSQTDYKKQHQQHSQQNQQQEFKQNPTNNSSFMNNQMIGQTPQMNWSKYFDQEGTPYYYNWITCQSQYETPPSGSIIYSAEGKLLYADTGSSNINQGGGNINDMNEGGIKKPGPSGANLFIFHLPSDYRDSDLMEKFRPFGNVISARVITQSDGKSKGYGFVSYDDPVSAQKAISTLNGLQCGSKRLLVKIKEGEDSSQKYGGTTLNQTKFDYN